MKYIFSILLILINLYGNNNFLKAKDAFKVNITNHNNNITININLDDTIYLYDSKLKIYINNTDITKQIFHKKPIKYHDFMVHFGQFSIHIPYKFIDNLKIQKPYILKLSYQGCSKLGLCYAPITKTFNINNKTQNNNNTTNETSNIANILTHGNIWMILITFFGFGLLLSLTPCIFPMIPILSGIIVQHSKSNNNQMSASKGFILSLIYVLAMSVAYTIAGVLAGLFGANIQAMLQNPTVLVIFAAIFVALAFSLFGYYSLELPQSFTNKINSITGKKDSNGGIASVAIMGFLSALIVGPCVAPPLAGALIYIGQTGDAILGGTALFIMSLGLGMPLLLVGAGAGKYMPKPGGWMDSVSKIFGVVMLALAVYMLDRILSSTITFTLYGLLSFGTAVYLFRSYKTIGRIFAILFVALGIYMGILATTTQKEYIHFQSITTQKELDDILKNTTKPVMLDFYAQWCVSCKELEHITYADPKVQEILSHYTLLKIDVTNNTDEDKALQKRFNIFGPPALIFWDKNANEDKSKKIIGFKTPQEFIDIVSK